MCYDGYILKTRRHNLIRIRKIFQMTQNEYDKLNPPVLQVIYDESKDTDFIEILNDSHWTSIGYIPTPQSQFGWFIYHLIHGIVMKYPFHKVLYFSLINTFQ